MYEDGFGTKGMISFYKLFGKNQDPEKKFPQLRTHSYTENDELKDG